MKGLNAVMNFLRRSAEFRGFFLQKIYEILGVSQVPKKDTGT